MHTQFFVVFYLQDRQFRKVGFIASKKVGNAVKRNFAKRRMRALFKEYSNKLKSGYYILVAKNSLNGADYQIINNKFNSIIKKFKR